MGKSTYISTKMYLNFSKLSVFFLLSQAYSRPNTTHFYALHCTEMCNFIECLNNNFISIAQQPLVNKGIHFSEVTRSHSNRHTTIGRTPLDKWSARHRGYYLTTNNTQNRYTSVSPAEFEPAVPAEWADADPRLRPRSHRGRSLNNNIEVECKTWTHNRCFMSETHLRNA